MLIVTVLLTFLIPVGELIIRLNDSKKQRKSNITLSLYYIFMFTLIVIVTKMLSTLEMDKSNVGNQPVYIYRSMEIKNDSEDL